MDATACVDRDQDAPMLVDMHFFKVLISETFDAQQWRDTFTRFVKEGHGEFGPVTAERVSAGPSYIEWGGWIGDQGLAMRVMACGHRARLWDVSTPRTLGVEGPEADQLAGGGYVMTSGWTR